ncbi:MAG TPA: type II toxin-antitoxin system mRNA interferase toxin, RelE/StbE family [Candidatus Saccharimonadales bacterium]|jgi:addiction module RelE/StbE family toxin|nr:type II toxin-antitoxin system mRNA interferase toxin, RelE/StbE family [Candidatus Saccharimonadales bacterium]
MKVRYLKSFQKQVVKLQPAQTNRLKAALLLFQIEPDHPDLYNHPLTGNWAGYRSIAFGGDLRAHYKMVNDIAVFVACGRHSQLYK